MQNGIVLNVDDIVHLNSGGPDLKVIHIETETAEVEWINESGNSDRLVLPVSCFHKV